MSEAPNYYAIIPANVRYDDELRANEKLLYGEITALTSKTGECWASNEYFAKLYGVSKQAVSKWILHLQRSGYITIKYLYVEGKKEIEKRIIEVSTKVDDVSTNVDGGINKCLQGYQQKAKENNTSINNTSMNKNKAFVRPSVQEVADYVKEANLNVDAQAFIDYYDSNGWKVGKVKMKDWKATCRGWHRREKPKSEIKSTYDIDKITHDAMYNDDYDI